jgi:mannitol operon transcriptional antiterminator
MRVQVPMINSRQKDLLRTLLSSKEPVSYDELAESFKLSKRTIQREISSLETFLSNFELKIENNIGKGIEIKGPIENVQQLGKELGQTKALSVYTPEERQEGMTYQLLLSKEPIKQFVFSNKYGVSEATISHDLDKVTDWLQREKVKLHRTPGVGIYIEGTEQQRRTTLSRLLHKDITFEEWIEIFHTSSGQNSGVHQQLEADIRNRLFKFVDTTNLSVVEQTVRSIVKHQLEIKLTDRNYVNLIVHVMLAVERIKHGDAVQQNEADEYHVIDPSIYLIAEKIVTRLEDALQISIPKMEVSYIALHLAGARISKTEYPISSKEELDWIESVQSYIRAVSFYLDDSLEGDEILLEGLVAHFVPAINRMKLQLPIHNPMLDEIKQKYPNVFQACKKAGNLLTERIGYPIPEDEIGYIAMHIGASVIRKKDILKQSFHAVVVCASGLGTSTYLASRLQNEIANVTIEAVISVNELEEFMKDNKSIDLLISTISLTFMNVLPCVTVSPFLSKKDVKSIQRELVKIKARKLPESKEDKEKSPSPLLNLAKYGEGVVQILRNLTVLDGVQADPPSVRELVHSIAPTSVMLNREQLIVDLMKREGQGGFAVQELAMLHTRTEGVNELIVGVFRLDKRISWKRDDNDSTAIHTVLLLAAPLAAPKEHIEMISEISATLIEDTFIETLASASPDKVKTKVETILANAYETKAKSTLKG